MNTSPIIAAPSAGSLAPGSGGLASPDNRSEFHQALQQAKSDANPGFNSGTDSSSVATSTPGSSGDEFDTERIAGASANGAGLDSARTVSTDVHSLANFRAIHLKVGVADISNDSKKEKSTGKTVSSTARINPKATGGSKENTQAPPSIPDPASNYVVPVSTQSAVSSTADPTTFAAPSSSTQESSPMQLFPPLDVAAAGADAIAIPPALDPKVVASNSTSAASGSLPATTASVSKASSESLTTEAAGNDALLRDDPTSAEIADHNTERPILPPLSASAVLPSLAAAPASHVGIIATRAKPETANSTARGNPVANVTDNSRKTDSVSNTSQQVPVPDPPAVLNGEATFQVSQPSTTPVASPEAGNETAPSHPIRQRSKSEYADRSAAQEITAAPPVVFDHASTAVDSTFSGHPSSTPPVTVLPSAPAGSTAETVQSAPTVFVPSSSNSVPTSSQAHPLIPSNPIPDPPRMVDSGQLRINQSSSELKISVQVPELGKIEVRAVTTHDITTAHVTASRPDALQLLATDRTGLEQALRSRDVILGSLNSHPQQQSTGQQREQNSHPSTQFRSSTSSTATAPSCSTEPVPPSYLPYHASISVRA